jgi:hypothetical protein
MQRIVFFLLFILFGFGLWAQNSRPIDVYLKQGKDSTLISNNTIRIKKLPFELVFVFHQPEQFSGVFVNTSYTKDYFKLDDSEIIPDLSYLPQKVYSEHKYNPNKELKVNSEFFQYFGYNPKSYWNKFDRIIKDGDKIIAYRKVHRFNLVEEGIVTEIGQMKFPVFMIFEIIRKRNSFSNDEVSRVNLKIKF